MGFLFMRGSGGEGQMPLTFSIHAKTSCNLVCLNELLLREMRSHFLSVNCVQPERKQNIAGQ